VWGDNITAKAKVATRERKERKTRTRVKNARSSERKAYTAENPSTSKDTAWKVLKKKERKINNGKRVHMLREQQDEVQKNIRGVIPMRKKLKYARRNKKRGKRRTS